ncbi:MAG: hypothetical protein ACR2G7_03160, partial [Acidimicrobiales bacterium]
MLVLISFGLVLVATVLLVLGLLTGTGLALIYLSIACSFVAAIVLLVATVFRRPAAETAAGPSPLASRVEAGEPASMGYTQASAPASSEGRVDDTAQVPAAASSAAYTPARRQPAMASVGGAGPMAGGDEADNFFPIEDYDQLKVGEILPLLPELYEDELDVVEGRERDTKGRVSVLKRIDQLRRAGAAEGVADASEEQLPADDGGDLFPIEDYDELTVGEILPLLPELYDDELPVVEAHERA